MGERIALQMKSERYQFVLGFVLLTSMAGVGIGIARVATSFYAVELHASTLQMGLISAAQSIGILLMALPVGIWIQQWGPKRLFILGSVLGGLVYAALTLHAQVLFLIVCTALISFCMPLRFVSLNSVFLKHLEQLGEAKAGWFRGTHMLGFFLIGPVAAVSLISQFGFNGTFLWVAATFFLTAMIAPLVLSDEGIEREPEHSPKLRWSEIVKRLGLLKQHEDLRHASTIEFCSSAVMAYYGFFIVVIAMKSFGFSAAQAASLVTIQGSVFVFALFVMGSFVQRLGYQRFYQVSFVLLIMSLLLLGLTQSAWWLWAGSIGLGLGQGMLHVINFTFFAKVGERIGIGQISGLTALAGPAGGLAGSLLGGGLGYWFGLQALFLPMALLFIGLLWRVRLLIPTSPMYPIKINPLPELESER